MTTVSFKPGATGPVVLRFEDDAGEAISYGSPQLRVQAVGQCLIVPGALAGDDWEFDLSILDPPPRPYAATIYHDAGHGWRQPDTINLHIQGGC